MRKAALAGLFACAVIYAMPSQKASALPLESLDINKSTSAELKLALLEVNQASEQKTGDNHEPVVHTVKRGETLTDIAKRHDTDWKRLYFKNKQIKHPDVIHAGDKLTIPDKDEKLKKRPIQSLQAPQADNRSASGGRTANTVRRSAPRATAISRGSSAGNLYVRGYCTWYVKNRRPDLPNNLGNAITWVSRAAAQGLSTGRTPRAGAVGQQGNHVVYVERVHSNGTVTVSEMNFKGWGVISRRTVPARSFTYIY